MVIGAGGLEVLWMVLFKKSVGFRIFWPAAGSVAAMVVSFTLLLFAVRSLPIGTAYGVWTGIGAAGTALAGILFFKESTDVLRIFFIAIIAIGVAGLRFTAK